MLLMSFFQKNGVIFDVDFSRTDPLSWIHISIFTVSPHMMPCNHLYLWFFGNSEWMRMKQQEQQRKEELQLMCYDPRQAFCFFSCFLQNQHRVTSVWFNLGKDCGAVKGNKIWLRCGLGNTWLQLTKRKLQAGIMRGRIIRNQRTSKGYLDW